MKKIIKNVGAISNRPRRKEITKKGGNMKKIIYIIGIVLILGI